MIYNVYIEADYHSMVIRKIKEEIIFMENENIISTIAAMQNALYVMITTPIIRLKWADNEQYINTQSLYDRTVDYVLNLYNDICGGKCEIISQHHTDEVIDTLRCIVAFKRIAAEEDKNETEEA
jgi:hypothetical protein